MKLKILFPTIISYYTLKIKMENCSIESIAENIAENRTQQEKELTETITTTESFAHYVYDFFYSDSSQQVELINSGVSNLNSNIVYNPKKIRIYAGISHDDDYRSIFLDHIMFDYNFFNYKKLYLNFNLLFKNRYCYLRQYDPQIARFDLNPKSISLLYGLKSEIRFKMFEYYLSLFYRNNIKLSKTFYLSGDYALGVNVSSPKTSVIINAELVFMPIKSRDFIQDNQICTKCVLKQFVKESVLMFLPLSMILNREFDLCSFRISVGFNF